MSSYYLHPLFSISLSPLPSLSLYVCLTLSPPFLPPPLSLSLSSRYRTLSLSLSRSHFRSFSLSLSLSLHTHKEYFGRCMSLCDAQVRCTGALPLPPPSPSLISLPADLLSFIIDLSHSASHSRSLPSLPP